MSTHDIITSASIGLIIGGMGMFLLMIQNDLVVLPSDLAAAAKICDNNDGVFEFEIFAGSMVDANPAFKIIVRCKNEVEYVYIPK